MTAPATTTYVRVTALVNLPGLDEGESTVVPDDARLAHMVAEGYLERYATPAGDEPVRSLYPVSYAQLMYEIGRVSGPYGTDDLLDRAVTLEKLSDAVRTMLGGSGTLPTPAAIGAVALTQEPKDRRAMRPFLARVRTGGRAPVWMITDSIGEGYGIGAQADRPPVRLAAELRNLMGLPAGGDGYIAPRLFASIQPADYPVQLVGGALFDGVAGPGGKDVFMTGAGQLSRYTFTGGTSVDCWYFNFAGGTHAIYLDGVKVGADVVASSASTDGAFTRVTVTGGPTAQHVLEVRWVAGQVLTTGFWHHLGDETSGLSVIDGTHSGADTRTFVGNANLVASLAAQAATIQPAMVYLELGTNGRANGYTGADFLTQLRLIRSTIRGALTAGNACTFVVDSVYRPTPDGTPTNAGAPLPVTQPWADYRAAMRTFADEDSATRYVDSGPLFRTDADAPTDQAGGFLRSDEAFPVHPTSAGARARMAWLARLISSSATQDGAAPTSSGTVTVIDGGSASSTSTDTIDGGTAAA